MARVPLRMSITLGECKRTRSEAWMNFTQISTYTPCEHTSPTPTRTVHTHTHVFWDGTRGSLTTGLTNSARAPTPGTQRVCNHTSIDRCIHTSYMYISFHTPIPCPIKHKFPSYILSFADTYTDTPINPLHSSESAIAVLKRAFELVRVPYDYDLQDGMQACQTGHIHIPPRSTHANTTTTLNIALQLLCPRPSHLQPSRRSSPA